MSAITAKASRKMKKYAVLTREPRCFLGSFDFSWEQRKLTEFVEFFSGLTYTPNDVQENGTLVLRSSNVSNGEVVDADNIYVNPQVVNSENVKVGDIVVVVRNGSRSLIGKHAQIKAFMPNTVIGAFMTGIRSECPEFTNALLNTSRFEEEIAMNMGATINQITGYMFSKMEFKVPCLDEQKKIGEYFEKLDNLITLHQRKCVFLFGLFQASISMIFTASTFSWEQRKFSDITFPAGEKNRDNLPLESYSITNEHGFVPQDEKFENGGTMREADKRMYYIVSPNSFAYNPARINVGSIGYQNIGKNVIVSSLYEVFKTSEDVDDRLLWHWFKSPDFQKLIMQLQEGGVRLYFYYDKLCMGEVSLPSLEEQRKIGKLFDTLDNLITLHQRECISFTVRAGGLILTANKKRTTSSWEQRKLGDVVKEITRNDPESEAPIMMITANNGFIEQSERYAFNNAGESLKKYILLKKGELAYNHGASKLRPYGSCFALTTAENARIPFVYHCFSAENQNAEFMSIELNGAEIENQLRKIVSSGARMDGLLNISFDEYTSVSVLLPGTEEQDRIADFFRHLDNLITLHQRKPFLMKWRTSDANRNQTNRLVL
jgi:type I restriction enzyme S subunit